MTRRAPLLVLVGGLACVVYGIVLLAFAGRIADMAWYAVPVALLGLVLVGVWVRDRRRPDPPPGTSESIAATLPGKWYPVAILGIAAGLMIWVTIWTRR